MFVVRFFFQGARKGELCYFAMAMGVTKLTGYRLCLNATWKVSYRDGVVWRPSVLTRKLSYAEESPKSNRRPYSVLFCLAEGEVHDDGKHSIST